MENKFDELKKEVRGQAVEFDSHGLFYLILTFCEIGKMLDERVGGIETQLKSMKDDVRTIAKRIR